MYLWCLKTCFDREIATESARSCPVPAALSGGDPRVPAQHRQRVPSVTGCRLPGLLAESLRVSLPPAGQARRPLPSAHRPRGRPGAGPAEPRQPPKRQKNVERRLSPTPPPPRPLYSQPEVEHGAGVHQQRPEERRRERVRRGRTPNPPHTSRYPGATPGPAPVTRRAADPRSWRRKRRRKRKGQGHGEGEAAPAPSPFPPRCPRSAPEAPGAEAPRAPPPPAEERGPR